VFPESKPNRAPLPSMMMNPNLSSLSNNSFNGYNKQINKQKINKQINKQKTTIITTPKQTQQKERVTKEKYLPPY
jgi:hypothetical protein